MLSKHLLARFLVLSFSIFAIGLAVRAAQQAKAPDTMILKGSPMGGVKFDHKAHSETYAANKCETCHHPSKPQKPATVPQQACRDCHTKPAKPPMKTVTQAAFHNPLAKAGTCIDCHLKMNAAEGKKAPTTCVQCHKKTNV